MANKKRKVSLDDYVSCYHYFERAIQNNRFMSEETNNSVRRCCINNILGEYRSGRM